MSLRGHDEADASLSSSAARDPAWFSTYTPFLTFATHHIMSSPQPVLGIGDVHLPVKLFPKRSGRGAHGMLHLRNVLHVPTSVCNTQVLAIIPTLCSSLETTVKMRQLPHRMADGSDTLSVAASGFLSSVGLLSALLLALPCSSQGRTM